MCGKREKGRSIKINCIFTFGVKTEHCGRRYKFFLALLVHLSAFLGHSPNGRSDPPVRMTWWSDELMTWCLPPGIRAWIIITTSEGFFSILWLVTCLPLILTGCCCHCSGSSLKSKTSVPGFSVLRQVNNFVVALSQSVNSVNKHKLRAQLGSWCTASRNQFRVLLFLRNPFLTCYFSVLYSSTPWSTACHRRFRPFSSLSRPTLTCFSWRTILSPASDVDDVRLEQVTWPDCMLAVCYLWTD